MSGNRLVFVLGSLHRPDMGYFLPCRLLKKSQIGQRCLETVTYKGSPLTAGSVTFYGEGNQVASCSIEPDGEYTVTNVPVGPTKIAVSVPPAVREPKGYKIPQSGEKSVQIPRNYSDGEKSGLTYTVVEGSQEHPIELK